MPGRLRVLMAGVRADTRAVAAVEFAAVFPVLIIIMTGVYEMSRAVSTTRRLTTVANSTATMLATNVTGSVIFTDLHYAYDSAMLTFPGVLSDAFSKGVPWTSDITISLAGVSFTPTPASCTSGCTYVANMVWTGAAAQRACGTNSASTADASTPSPTTLPADLFAAVSVPSGSSPSPRFAVVVDVAYTWTPLLFSRFFGPVTIRRSAYITPRYVSQITYSKILLDDGFGKECPGF